MSLLSKCQKYRYYQNITFAQHVYTVNIQCCRNSGYERNKYFSAGLVQHWHNVNTQVFQKNIASIINDIVLQSGYCVKSIYI